MKGRAGPPARALTSLMPAGRQATWEGPLTAGFPLLSITGCLQEFQVNERSATNVSEKPLDSGVAKY